MALMNKTTHEVIDANYRAGMFYFTPSTMAFFHSRIESTEAVEDPNVPGTHLFITSEQFDPYEYPEIPRKFTIRRANADASIDDASEFQQYATIEEAQTALKEMTK
jgi:hypothetical protein